MSFVPAFYDYLVTHFQQSERRRMLSSLAVSVAPELWISLESAALLDINRSRFGLDESLGERSNVPRWLIAAERKKVDLWVEDLRGDESPVAIEFKMVHNNKNAYSQIRSIRKDFAKTINTPCNESVERWGIVTLVFSHFYDDQSGNFVYHRDFTSREDLLGAFAAGIVDEDPWYAGTPCLELAMDSVLICETATANFIDPDKSPSAIYMALARRKQNHC